MTNFKKIKVPMNERYSNSITLKKNSNFFLFFCFSSDKSKAKL